jgi:hypothetical protein
MIMDLFKGKIIIWCDENNSIINIEYYKKKWILNIKLTKWIIMIRLWSWKVDFKIMLN